MGIRRPSLKNISVSASVFSPEDDGIACPGIDEYNDRIIEKEKGCLYLREPAATGLLETSPKKTTYGYCNRVRAG